jgi:MSHA pilin protein MshA
MKKNLAGNEKGFTLIELIVVIVLLGILAAVAIPRYQDLAGDARTAAAQGVLAAARGAATMTFARNLITPNTAAQITADATGVGLLIPQIQSDNQQVAGADNTFTVTISGTDFTYEVTPSETGTNPAGVIIQ